MRIFGSLLVLQLALGPAVWSAPPASNEVISNDGHAGEICSNEDKSAWKNDDGSCCRCFQGFVHCKILTCPENPAEHEICDCTWWPMIGNEKEGKVTGSSRVRRQASNGGDEEGKKKKKKGKKDKKDKKEGKDKKDKKKEKKEKKKDKKKKKKKDKQCYDNGNDYNGNGYDYYGNGNDYNANGNDYYGNGNDYNANGGPPGGSGQGSGGTSGNSEQGDGDRPEGNGNRPEGNGPQRRRLG